jgi:quinol monooxygenase YgiN
LLVISRFRVTDAEAAGFLDRARAATAAFAARPGFVRARIGRAADDPDIWVLTTEWQSVGAFRRSLSDFDVKVHSAPLLAQSLDEPAAFEVLESWDGDQVSGGRSDLATDAAAVAVGSAATPAAPRSPLGSPPGDRPR